MSGGSGRRRGGRRAAGTGAAEPPWPPPAVGAAKKREGRSWRKQKLLDIHEALGRDPVDVEALRAAARGRGGLLSDQVRRRVWPRLLGLNPYDLPPHPGRGPLRDHRDSHQVRMDVERSLGRFPPGMRAEQRSVLQGQLVALILAVLHGRPELHYYQGYHELALVFLLVLGPRSATALLDRLSTHHLRDFMDPTMDSTKHILNYLSPLLARESPRLHRFMERWLLTWFGHVLPDTAHVLRLADFFLASHPLMPIYLAAAVVLHREAEVLDGPCEMAHLYHLLSRLPPHLPDESLLARALQLFAHHPHPELARQAAPRHRRGLASQRTIWGVQDWQEIRRTDRPPLRGSSTPVPALHRSLSSGVKAKRTQLREAPFDDSPERAAWPSAPSPRCRRLPPSSGRTPSCGGGGERRRRSRGRRRPGDRGRPAGWSRLRCGGCRPPWGRPLWPLRTRPWSGPRTSSCSSSRGSDDAPAGRDPSPWTPSTPSPSRPPLPGPGRRRDRRRAPGAGREPEGTGDRGGRAGGRREGDRAGQ
ncbi:TBC1 domain family member 20-like isoform X2 [Ornithorhynchus anatinus]|uniref:TBC1 domain family member 20-like isoform X2 n=1 Tax=Ornithorhynchus anatinus TaxID=9258 RepID=UPI0019D42686|nr:TBC1 domain family member 20-like isoform X2 [Ornithorhynchus anatinus]